jgi:hypothetical protein
LTLDSVCNRDKLTNRPQRKTCITRLMYEIIK